MDEAELEKIRKVQELLEQEGWEDAIGAEDDPPKQLDANAPIHQSPTHVSATVEAAPPHVEECLPPESGAKKSDPHLVEESPAASPEDSNVPQPGAQLSDTLQTVDESPAANPEDSTVHQHGAQLSDSLTMPDAANSTTEEALDLQPSDALADVAPTVIASRPPERTDSAASMVDVPLSEPAEDASEPAQGPQSDPVAVPRPALPSETPKSEVQRPKIGIPKVSITDNFVSGPNIMYEIRVEVGEYDWKLTRRYKAFEALHKKLTESVAKLDQERREGGAARTNVAVPRLPVKKSQLTAIMSRCKTASSSEFAAELGAFLKHAVTACKGTPLLSLITDWLEAPKHMALLEKGLAGPMQAGPSGSFRILMEARQDAPKAALAELPTTIAWGETVGQAPLHEALDRLQLAVQKLKTWEGGPMDEGSVWFEFSTVAPEDRRQRCQVRCNEDCCFNVEGPYGEVEITCWSTRMGTGWVDMSHHGAAARQQAADSSENAKAASGPSSRSHRRGLAGWTRVKLGELFPRRVDGLRQVWSRMWAPIPAYPAPDPPPPHAHLYFVTPPACVTEGEPFIFWAAQRIWSMPCPKVKEEDGQRMPTLCILPNVSCTTSPFSVYVQGALTTSQAFKLHELQREERAAAHYRPLTRALCGRNMALTRSILTLSPPPVPFAAAMRVLVDEQAHFALVRRLVREDALASAADSSCAVTEGVSVQLLRALGMHYVSNVIGGLVEEICAAGRDLEIDAELSVNQSAIDSNALLLSELACQFFISILSSVSPGHQLLSTSKRNPSALIGPPNAGSLRLLKVIQEEMGKQVEPVVAPATFMVQVFVGGFLARAVRDPLSIIASTDTSISHQAYRTLFWIGKALEQCGGITSLQEVGPQGMLAAAVSKYAEAIRTGLQALVEQQVLDRDAGVGAAGGGMGAASDDLREVHKFMRKEYRSIASDLGDDQRIAMEMELGDASGKLTWSEAAGVVRKEVEHVWQLIVDLGQPLPREDEKLLKATIKIQRAVRLWQFVFVGVDEERVVDSESCAAAGWSIPSYSMVPDQAAVVFWHQSGRGCLCAPSSWEVVQAVGIAAEDGRMPTLAKQRSAGGLASLQLSPFVCEGAVFLLRRNGDSTVSLQATNGDTLQRSRQEPEEAKRRPGQEETKVVARLEHENASVNPEAAPSSEGGEKKTEAVKRGIHLAMGLDFSLHGRFYLEYEETSGLFAIREGTKRVGVRAEQEAVGAEAADDASLGRAPSGLSVDEAPKLPRPSDCVEMVDGDGDWRWRIEVVSFPDLTAPREARGGGFFGVRLQDGMTVAFRSGHGHCAAVQGAGARLLLDGGDLIGPEQTWCLRRCAILPFSANVFALQTEAGEPATPDSSRAKSSMKALFGGATGGARKGSQREEKKTAFVSIAADGTLVATASDISAAEPWLLEPDLVQAGEHASCRVKGFRLRSLSRQGAYVTAEEDDSFLRVMSADVGSSTAVCRLMAEVFTIVPIQRQALVQPQPPASTPRSSGVSKMGAALSGGLMKAAATLSPSVFTSNDKPLDSKAPSRGPDSGGAPPDAAPDASVLHKRPPGAAEGGTSDSEVGTVRRQSALDGLGEAAHSTQGQQGEDSADWETQNDVSLLLDDSHHEGREDLDESLEEVADMLAPQARV